MRVLSLLGLLVVLIQPVRADEGATLGATDRAAIRAVVEEQLAAFQRDDERAAFHLASPTIQQQFKSSGNFMRMVRSGYKAVYRPRDVQFGEIEMVDGNLIQRVELIGPDGAPALAHYVMQRQPDGSWRINGCFLTASEQRTT
jgi:ketosteroid isomerase-like protein